MPTVRLQLDFISPYVWLALLEAERFGEEHAVAWQIEPVVYVGLLKATGLVGPVETEAKRNYTFDDVVRCAARLGRGVVGPPTHPFRSLEALRTLWLFRREACALQLARRLADAAWGRGEDLTRLEVLEREVETSGLDASDLGERLLLPETKRGLTDSTAAAIRLGVFGVPTFVFEGELFWGHDRMAHLGDRLAGRARPAREASAPLIRRGPSVRREPR